MTNSRRRYSTEEKDKLIKRMLPPENCSPSKLAIETGISKSTLSTWKTKAKRKNSTESEKPKRNLTSREKFMVVMETYTLSETELSKYCRENGYYVEDVKRWRSSCIEANDTNNNVNKSELNEEKKKSKELAKELKTKDKALAETTSLLVLRKKLNAIFGENEED